MCVQNSGPKLCAMAPLFSSPLELLDDERDTDNVDEKFKKIMIRRVALVANQ
jgi:hypothetical protein